MLEAGIELMSVGVIAATVAAFDLLPLSWHGFALATFFYAAIAALVMAGLTFHAPHRHFGLANAITLWRAAFDVILLVVVVEALLGEPLLRDTGFRWELTIIAVTALLLDGVDGWAARRGNMTSAFGARFDMETDAAFMLALAMLLAVSGIVGPWVLTSGLIYYLFRIATAIWPALSAPLFPSWRRKTICVVQAALLIAALAPSMPQWGAQLCCVIGLILLLASFAIDTLWLVNRARSSQDGDAASALLDQDRVLAGSTGSIAGH